MLGGQRALFRLKNLCFRSTQRSESKQTSSVSIDFVLASSKTFRETHSGLSANDISSYVNNIFITPSLVYICFIFFFFSAFSSSSLVTPFSSKHHAIEAADYIISRDSRENESVADFYFWCNFIFNFFFV